MYVRQLRDTSIHENQTTGFASFYNQSETNANERIPKPQKKTQRRYTSVELCENYVNGACSLVSGMAIVSPEFQELRGPLDQILATV